MVYSLVLLNNLLNTSPRIFLSLGSRNSRHLIVKTRVPLLSLPSRWPTVTEQHFNLLDSLTARFWIREPELNGATEAKCSENDEESPADIEKCGWNEETDGEVEQPYEISDVSDVSHTNFVKQPTSFLSQRYPFLSLASRETILLQRTPSISVRGSVRR
jgi:hypothetical protein